MSRLNPGDTVGRRYRFYDEDNALVDPDAITVQILNPSGEEEDSLTIADLTHESTGVFKLSWNLPSDAAKGLWLIIVTGEITLGDLVNTETFSFLVEAT